MLDQINDIMETAMSDEKFMPNIAKMMKKPFDELLKAGFTEDQASRIVANYKMS